MNVTSEQFLRVLKLALLGQKMELNEQMSPQQWRELFRVAGIHAVLPMVYDAVYATIPLQLLEEPFVLMAKREVKQQVMLQTVRTCEFLKLNQKFHAAGVKPLVVKGIICRSLYPQPDQRLSADEDLLILPEQMLPCHQILTQQGLTTDHALTDFEVSYTQPNGALYLEIHQSLFPPENGAYGDLNRFFEGVFERAIVEQIQGVPVCTMGYTDHLFYLICHAFKHFLHSGFGIRQVCDIVMYANRYGAQIDWMQILDECRQIHATQFAAALFQIGSKYLVFDADKAAYPPAWRAIEVDEGPLLEDLLESGVHGNADSNRQHSSGMTLGAVQAQKAGSRSGGIWQSLFPGVRTMEKRYPYLKKYPVLLPVAWCNRIWHYGRQSSREDAAQSVRVGTKRIELLRQYGILEQ